MLDGGHSSLHAVTTCRTVRPRWGSIGKFLLRSLLGWFFVGTVLAGTDAAEPAQYIRLRYPTEAVSWPESKLDDGRKADPLALETAIARFLPQPEAEAGLEVDLVAAVHVGELGYYEELNRRFRDYDVVLYELVAESNTRLTPDLAQRRENAVTVLQGGMQDSLGLSHQLACVDYLRDNFVRADMTPEEFLASMRKRNESFAKMFFRMAGNALALQSEDAGAGDLRIMTALLKEDRQRELKVAMAEQLYRFGGSMRALDGPDGSTLVTERNRKALDGLQEQIERGKKRIAIFYGAAHMPDFHTRLVNEFQLRPDKVDWIEAWNLRKDDDDNRKGRGTKAVDE